MGYLYLRVRSPSEKGGGKDTYFITGFRILQACKTTLSKFARACKSGRTLFAKDFAHARADSFEDTLAFRAVAGLLFGLIMGSFVTMASYRIPRGLSIIAPSSCPACGHRLGVRDLFPVFSWLFQRGRRCRYCRKTIPARYPLIELSVAVAFIGLFLSVQSFFALPLFAIAIVWIAVWIVILCEQKRAQGALIIYVIQPVSLPEHQRGPCRLTARWPHWLDINAVAVHALLAQIIADGQGAVQRDAAGLTGRNLAIRRRIGNQR